MFNNPHQLLETDLCSAGLWVSVAAQRSDSELERNPAHSVLAGSMDPMLEKSLEETGQEHCTGRSSPIAWSPHCTCPWHTPWTPSIPGHYQSSEPPCYRATSTRWRPKQPFSCAFISGNGSRHTGDPHFRAPSAKFLLTGKALIGSTRHSY